MPAEPHLHAPFLAQLYSSFVSLSGQADMFATPMATIAYAEAAMLRTRRMPPGYRTCLDT